MAGQLTISTLNDSSGVLATRNGMTGIAKAWVIFGGGNGTTSGQIFGSFNVSSITVVGTGDWIANYTTAMPDINNAPIAQGFGNNNASNNAVTQAGYNNRSATATEIKHWENGSPQSVGYVVLAVFSN